MSRAATAAPPLSAGRAAGERGFRSPARGGVLGSIRGLERREEPGLPFRWSVDPWPGRIPGFPLFESVPRSATPPAFEGRILSASVLARLVRRDLVEVGPGEAIAIGALADPWPADESTAFRARRVLDELETGEGLRLSLTTRSDGILRDVELLAELAGRHAVRVHVAVPTLDRRLAAALEPGTPRPDLRLKAVSRLAAAGVPVGVRIAPLLPDVTDEAGPLDRLAEAAAGAGAAWLVAGTLVLPPSRLRALFPELAREEPDRVAGAARRYHATATLPAEHRAALADLVERLRRKHGLTGLRSAREDLPAPSRGPQLELF